MELYRDFDYESDSSNDINYNPNSQLKHKNKNTFVFESFTSKLKKLTVRFSEKIDIDYSLLKLNENDKIKKDEDKIMKCSNFKSLLEREFSSNNQNEEFNSLYNLLYEYSSSYVYLLNNYKKVFNILKEDIQKKIENKYWRGIYSSLDLLIAVIKDLRNECYDYFVDNNLSQIVNITKIDNDIKNEILFDLIDHIFTFFVNIFKFYKNSFEGNFEKILIIYSDLLFNRNKFIRKFASQSLTYIIKNLDDNQLTKTFNFLFNFIIHPEKLFEEKDIDMLNNEDFSSKNILSQKLSFFNLKIFISDCLSELLTEVLTNRNVLSNISDIILFKLKGIDSNLKDKNEVLLVFINTFLKLVKKVREDNKINVVCLLHYFLLTFYSNKELNFKKIKLKNLTNQLNEFDESNFSNEKILLGLILYSKELLTKNFKDNSTTFSIYINSLLEKIENYINYNEINLNTSLIIEIYCLMLKFHHSELTFDINKILKKEEYIQYLFETLINLDLFPFYQSFSTFSIRNPNDSIDNEEYNNISYNKEIFEDIIIKIINENEFINYDLLVQIIKSYEKLFGKCEINLINKDSIKNKIKSHLSSIKNNEISKMITNMNEINYDKLTKLFIISSMINEKTIITIISNEIIKYLSQFIDKEVNFNEFLIHIFLNDFYLNQFHYLNNIQLYLNILTSFKSFDEISKDIIKNECPYLFSYIKYYSFKQNQNDMKIIFSTQYSYLLLLSNDNQNKINFIKLFEKYFYEKYKKEYEQNNKKEILDNIFNTMEKICKTNFDYLNDKKYNLNLEIIVSQIELILSNEGITKFNLDLIIFSFFFLLGNFWISLTKSVWPIISKSLENLFTALIKSSNIDKYSNYELDIKTNLLDLINKLFIFIANYPSESDFYSKNYFRIKKEWVSLKNNESIHTLNINELQIKYRTISTFFNGITFGLSNYYILLNSSQNFSFDFLDNCIIKIDHCFKSLYIEKIFSNPKDKTELCILYNYMIDKEMKSSYSNTIFKLKESLFLIISKLNSLLYYKNFDSLKKVIYEQIIISRSITIQKYSIEIISLFENRIKNYLNLLKNIIESTTVINQIFNINKIINDNGHEIKEEEREILIPIITRLYYSKYFYLKDDLIERGKKMKTKNKINLVNYFIQLRQNEFEEYLNIVFEPIFLVFENNKKENFNTLNLKIYKKLLDIIKLNLKQITSLFNNNNQITIISNKIKLCFIFLKHLGQKIKSNKEDLINSTEKYIHKYLSNENNILNAYDKEEFKKFFAFMYKNIKEIKKESFNIFTMIFNKFYDNTNLVSQISKTICQEYTENLKKITTKINSIYKFFISLSKHAKLHFIFAENSMIIENLMNIIKNKETERAFILNIIECIENILSPYSIDNINTIENENVTQMEISEDEDSNNFNYHKNDTPIDDKTLQYNFVKIILFNFNNFNESLTSLIFNNKIGTSIKDNLTIRIIEIFLSLWSLYTNSNKNKNVNYEDLKIDNILSFLLKILEKDKKIYQERDILNNVLKLSHILVIIKKIKYQSNKSNLEEMKNLYQIFTSLIYKVENYNNRLIVSIILQEFSFIDPTNKLINVLELISYLNSNKQKNRELGKELDSDSVIEKINLINENFINENLSVIEPLIYQLIILSNNEEFALSTLALDKAKLIFQKISLLNIQENFISVINVLFYLLNEKFSLAKNIMEFLYEINSKTQNKISCSDLYEIVNEDKSNYFLLNILNFKYDLRSDALDLLINYFQDSNKTISQYSIVNVIIPIIKNFLNFKNYSENPSNIRKFTLKRKNEILNEIVNKSILIIPELVKRISEEEIEKLLLYFYSNLKKLSQNKYKDNMLYSIDIYKITNKSLTKILESIISIKFNKIQFDSNFKIISEKYIIEKAEQMELKLKETEITKEKNKPILNINDMYINIFEDLNTNLIESITESSNNNLYKIIKNQIYPQLKSLLYDEEKRKNKNSYYIRNYIIIPYLNILKILNPNNIRTEIIQLTIELVNNLKNLDTGIRIKAREGIKNMINTLDENITIILFENMKSKLNSGYQRHVLGYTINYLLSFINNYKITEISLFLIMPILFDEIFGDISKEKEINNLVNKYKEAKNDKSLNSFELISQKISITSLILGIIIPLKNYLIIRKNTSESFQKVNEVLNSIVKGLKSNLLINKDNMNEIYNILEYSYILTNMVIEKNIQNVKEIKKMKGIEIKGNDIYTIDISEHYKIEIANKYMEEKNDILYSNLLASLGLDFILILFKKKILDISEIVKGSDLYEKINCLINNIVICLKMSNNTILVSKAIKIIINFIESSDKFFIIKKNLNKIVKNLFKLILSINKGDTLLSQSVLNGISTILTKFTFVQIPNEKIKTCIQFLKVNINNTEIKPYVLSCILALIKRKILHPDIYDMINYLKEIYLTSFEQNTITICFRIFFEFINNYPLEKKGRMNHINYFIINCDSKTRKCKINSIKMLNNFVSKKMEGIEENYDFILLNLFTLYMNNSDSEIKENINELINQLYENYDKNNFKSYYEKAVNFINNTKDNENQKMINLSLVMISIMLNLKFDFINNSLMNKFDNLLKSQINIFENLIEERMNKYDYLIKGENTIKLNNINVEDYNTLYLILICIEKANKNYSMEISNEILKRIILCLNHPHSFIKTISLRIILQNSNKITFNDDLINIISHLKFILMTNDYEDKIYEYSEQIILNFISNKLFIENDNILDLLTTLCNESKKWISNKETGLSILNRITNIFAKIVEGENNIFYFKPIIELCYRINNNNLASDELKKKCNIIMENISSKMKKDDLTKIYKEVIKEVNYLKQKRKLEQVENYRKKYEGKEDKKIEQNTKKNKKENKTNSTKLIKKNKNK